MKVDVGVKERLLALKKLAPSQAEMARVGGVKDGTIIRWTRQIGANRLKLVTFAQNLGVDPDWLISGRGDSEEQLAKAKAALTSNFDETRSPKVFVSHRFGDSPMECPMIPHGGAQASTVERMAARMDPRALALSIADTLGDSGMSANDRHITALRQAAALIKKLNGLLSQAASKH